RINVRIAANIDPQSDKEMKILEEFIDKPNFAFRHYPDENLWGISKDMEEIIIGAVSGFDVAGVGSVIDEHIKNFAPVLESAWMKGKPIKSLDDARMIQVKRMPRAIKREIITTTTSVSSSYIGVASQESDYNTTISSQIITDAFASKKAEAKTKITEKLNEIKDFLKTNPNKGDIGQKLDDLKEFIINIYGFSRLVFDISKISREYLQDPKKILDDLEIQKLSDSLKIWENKL
ncbi:MAG: hypothetical protein ACTSVV_17985, partial [Promethearchaeota archaeon]